MTNEKVATHHIIIIKEWKTQILERNLFLDSPLMDVRFQEIGRMWRYSFGCLVGLDVS